MKYLPKHIIVGILLEIIILSIAYFEANDDITHFFQAAARLSGRVSLLFFSLLLVYDTLKTSNSDSVALQTKFILARNFAILHVIHWFLLATAVSMSSFELVPFRVAGGTLAYLMIVLLPFVIKRKILTNLPINWVFHIYIPYVWLIFFLTYLTRVQGKAKDVTGSMLTYKILITYSSILILWRISVLMKNSKNKATIN
jgi:VanZ family protein